MATKQKSAPTISSEVNRRTPPDTAKPTISKALQAPLVIRGKAKKGAAELGLHTVEDLIWHIPFRYEDRTHSTTIAELAEMEKNSPDGKVKEKQTVIGTIAGVSMHRIGGGRGRFLVETTLKDDTGTLKITWFNRPWIYKEVKQKGAMLLVYGTYKNKQFYPEEYEVGLSQVSETLTPVYPTNENITSLKIRELLEKHKDAIKEVDEFLPAEVVKKYGFPSRSEALMALHFPPDAEYSTAARMRLAFDELLIWELTLLRKRHQRDTAKSISIQIGRASCRERV